MWKMPSDDVLESLHKLRKRKSAQFKTVWSCTTWKFIRISHYETLTPEMKELKLEQWLRFARVNVVLEEDKENAINGKQKGQWSRRGHVVTGTMKIGVHTRHQKPRNPLSHQHTEVEVRRGKEPQSVESTWEVRSTVVQRPLEMYLHRITL